MDNLGGGRDCNCSMLEAIALCERISGRTLDSTLSGEGRVGDHRWWILALCGFREDYPDWDIRIDLERTVREIYEHNADRWDSDGIYTRG